MQKIEEHAFVSVRWLCLLPSTIESIPLQVIVVNRCAAMVTDRWSTTTNFQIRHTGLTTAVSWRTISRARHADWRFWEASEAAKFHVMRLVFLEVFLNCRSVFAHHRIKGAEVFSVKKTSKCYLVLTTGCDSRYNLIAALYSENDFCQDKWLKKIVTKRELLI